MIIITAASHLVGDLEQLRELLIFSHIYIFDIVMHKRHARISSINAYAFSPKYVPRDLSKTREGKGSSRVP